MVLGALPSPAPSAEAPPPPPTLGTSFGQQQGAPRSDLGGAPTQNYAHLVRTLQQRSVSRASSTTAAVAGEVAPSATTTPATSASQIEQDLKLAAQIGQTLLNEKAALHAKLDQSERANQKLLERLGTAVKDNNKLEKRLEESLGNLDQADSSNRALLVSLEEDRKTISRLSHDSGKLVAASATLKQLQIAHADVLEDLAAERRRADLAEARARKAAERAEELDERLRKACSDLEEMRQDKVLSAKRSSDALALLKAKQASAAGNAPSSGGDDTGGDGNGGSTRELMRIVETLVEENHLLRSESMELHGLLEREREDQELAREENGFLSALGIREHGGSDDNGGGEEQDQADNVPRRRSGGGFMLRRLSASSSLSHTSPQLDHAQEPGVERPMASRTRSTAASNGGQIPSQRPRNRRTQSMDVTSQLRSSVGTSSAPNSPYQGGVPFGRPASILSNASEDPDTSLSSSIRPRRRHRPLSLSLNSSVFSPSMVSSTPNPEAEESVLVSPFTRPNAHRRQSSQTSFNFGLASPRTDQPGRRISRSPRPSPSRRPSSTAGVDASTQTSRPSSPAPPRSRRSTTPHRHAAPDSLPQTPIAATDNHRHASHDSIASPASSSAVHSAGGGGAAVRTSTETRTAALAQLIEYGVKLLARIQAADIATQEKRLRKQNLPGDVKHLAQANIKELAGDIDSLRDRFRRVVELERAAQHRDHTLTARQDPSGRNDISLVTRRDFVSLVKLLRDLLSETSRLRQLVNRVQLEPALAQRLSELDVPGAVDAGTTSEPKTTRPAAAEAAATLLAPLSRLLGVASPEQASSSPADSARPNLAQSRRGGSSTVSTATINVEFGGGGMRPAPSSTLSPDSVTSRRASPTGTGAHPRQVRRELSSIFAGASTSTRRAQSPGPGVQSREIPTPAAGMSTSRLVSAAASAATSYMPFSRILSSYRPAMSSTANAVIDSIPSAPPVLDSPFDEDDEDGGTYSPPSTLLERQLRPRGLSDSSVRSTFGAHAGHARPNPHHRIVTAAGLALSSEATPVPIVVAPAGVSADEATSNAAIALSSSPASLGAAMSALRQKLEEDDADTAAALAEGKTISRRASRAHLRGRASSSRLRESSTIASSSPPPPVPPLPPLSNDLKLSTSTATSDSSLSLSNHEAAHSSPNPTVSIQAPNTPPAASAPIAISPSSTRPGDVAHKPKDPTTSSSSSLFGAVVSSAFGSLIGGGAGAGNIKRASVLGAPHGGPESFRERGRLG